MCKHGTTLHHPPDATGDTLPRRFDSQFVPAFYKLLRSATKEEAAETSAILVKEVEFLQNNISPTGPYLMGAELTLVDAAVIPFFIRLCVIKHYR